MKNTKVGFLLLHDFLQKKNQHIDLEVLELLSKSGHSNSRARVFNAESLPDILMYIRNKTIELNSFCNDNFNSIAYIFMGYSSQPNWVYQDYNLIHRYLTAICIELQAIGFNVVFCIPNFEENNALPEKHQKWLKKLKMHVVGKSTTLGYRSIKFATITGDYWHSISNKNISNIANVIYNDIESNCDRHSYNVDSTKEEKNGTHITRMFVLRG